MTHNDEKHLHALSCLHYVAAGFATWIPLLGAVYTAVGVALLLGKLPLAPGTSSRGFGWMPFAMGVFVILIGVATVGTNLLTGRSLRTRKRYTLCLLTSAMNCMHVPLGTLLGAFTLIVLCRPSVRAAFKPPSERPVNPDATGLGGTLEVKPATPPRFPPPLPHR